jgi:hypothetical protein
VDKPVGPIVICGADIIRKESLRKGWRVVKTNSGSINSRDYDKEDEQTEKGKEK